MAKTKVPLDQATLDQLRQFCVDKGLDYTPHAPAHVLRGVISRSALAPENVIPVDAEAADEPEGLQPPAAAKPSRPTQAAKGIGADGKPTHVTITLQPNAHNADKASEFVGVNGVGMLVPFGRPVRIPVAYFEVLKNAKETHYRVIKDADGQEQLVPVDVQSYPYSVESWG